VEGEEAERHWQEWEDLRNLLSQEDITYLRGGKLYHRVEGAVLAHAKIAIGEEEGEWYDNTKDWNRVVGYGGQWGHAWVGHTRVTKVGRWSYDHLTLLDFDVKQRGVVGVGRVETGEVWEVSEGGVVMVREGW
jgi:hypothetical protein